MYEAQTKQDRERPGEKATMREKGVCGKRVRGKGGRERGEGKEQDKGKTEKKTENGEKGSDRDGGRGEIESRKDKNRETERPISVAFPVEQSKGESEQR